MSVDDRFQSANFNRPPRLHYPALNQDHVDIPAPPPTPPLSDQGLVVTLLPVLGIGVMALFYLLRAVNSSGDSFFFAIPMFFLAAFTIGGTVLAARWRQRDHQRRKRETELTYLRTLDAVRVRLQAGRDAQIGLLEAAFPASEEALSRALARDPQLWERRPHDPDFGAFRLGVGTIPSRIAITTPTASAEGVLMDRALALAEQYRTLPEAPISASLTERSSVGFCGERGLVLESIRAAVCHLAVTHAPHDFHIHLVAPHAHYNDWRWLEWLPHASQSHRGGAAELSAFDHDNIRNLMGNLAQVIDERRDQKGSIKTPHLLLIIDGTYLVETEPVYTALLREGHLFGASALCIADTFESLPGDCGTVVEVFPDATFRCARTGAGGYEVMGRKIDSVSTQDMEHIARALSSVVMRETGGAGRIPRYVNFLDLYGVRSADLLTPLLRARWRRGVPRGVLPHPIVIGSESAGVRTELALDEDHHGPHGMLAGTTGSGKSELLQTMICSMVIEHDPRLLNLLLIDFKGGSTFNVFAGLPHVVGMVTNLDGTLVERALEALRAEVQWRQRFLKSANARDITQYHRLYTRSDASLNEPTYHPLPHLFIIVDEFAQLAKELPDFLRELVRIVQVGRSLGLHLILGTQSPMDVITDEMNANLQFRICLRVQNIESSRAMLRRPDAAYLPSGWPGRGYFQVGERGVFKQFQTAYVGGDYERQQVNMVAMDEPLVLELITDSGQVINLLPEAARLLPTPERQAEESYTAARAICDVVIDYATREGIGWMKPILLPLVPATMTLSTPLNLCGFGGWNGRDWQGAGRDQDGIPIRTGSAPIGVIDDVYNRTQPPLWAHLNTGEATLASRKDGHLLIVGSPGSGKTTVLRSLAISEALLHAPDNLHMYFVSFTGTGLDDLGGLPHAERVIYGTAAERIRRLFGRLIHLLNERQTGRAESTNPVIMVCIDQFEQFRDLYRETHMADFERLVNEGRAAGIYLVFTASSISAIPDRIRSLVQQRIALQAGDPSDYVLIVGRLERQMHAPLPAGRGFISHSPPLLCQIALPCTQEDIESEPLALEQMRALIRDMRAGYEAKSGRAQSPAPIDELPKRIVLDDLPLPDSDTRRLVTPLGRWDDDALSVYELDWAEDGPHFIVTGPPGSGKTNLLHAAVLAAARQLPPDTLRFLLVDFTGRNLKPLAGLKHVICRVTEPIDFSTELAHLNAEMQAMSARLHEQGAAHVPATVVVIDDYDAVSEELRLEDYLLAQLRDHLRLHADANFYLWVAGYLERTVDPLIRHLMLKRSGFGLSVRESLQKLNARTMGLPVDAMPEGRAYLPVNNRIGVVQTALVENAPALVDAINAKWAAYGQAAWQSEAGSFQAARRETGSYAPIGSYSIDIDTAGLIEDLLGDLYDDVENAGGPVAD